MVKEIRKELADKYLHKAEEFYASALENFQKRRFNAACFDASQSIIMANDSFCIAILGRRASKDHREAVNMHIEAARVVADTSKKEIISMGIDQRSEFGYTEKTAQAEDAHNLIVRSRRFVDWVKEKIK
jgi:HEPN domain-containing protein